MAELLSTRVGDRVTWHVPTQGVRSGVVVRVASDAHSLATDELMGREPGESLAEFGRLLFVRCDRCPACAPGRREWLHSLNESQLQQDSGAVPLFDLSGASDD